MALSPSVAREIKAEIVRRGLKCNEVAREAGIRVDRLSKILARDREPRPGELALIAAAVERLAPRGAA